jgi:hypothetical protein
VDEPVPDDVFYEGALDRATHREVVSGFAGSQFRPDQPVTRGQLALILSRLASNPDAWVGAGNASTLF